MQQLPVIMTNRGSEEHLKEPKTIKEHIPKHPLTLMKNQLSFRP
jgi:hypothetical protein